MKLHEIAYVIGDDGGMHHHLDKAIRNMEHHGKKHSAATVRKACVDAAEALKRHSQNPNAMNDDPHSLLKILSIFHGEPDEMRIVHATITLGSYVPSDSD
jgi:hypothetical protein